MALGERREKTRRRGGEGEPGKSKEPDLKLRLFPPSAAKECLTLIRVRICLTKGEFLG